MIAGCILRKEMLASDAEGLSNWFCERFEVSLTNCLIRDEDLSPCFCVADSSSITLCRDSDERCFEMNWRESGAALGCLAWADGRSDDLILSFHENNLIKDSI